MYASPRKLKQFTVRIIRMKKLPHFFLLALLSITSLTACAEDDPAKAATAAPADTKVAETAAPASEAKPAETATTPAATTTDAAKPATDTAAPAATDAAKPATDAATAAPAGEAKPAEGGDAKKKGDEPDCN